MTQEERYDRRTTVNFRGHSFPPFIFFPYHFIGSSAARGILSGIILISYIPLVADGGINSPVDIAVALALGADSVMMNNFFARFTESSGKLLKVNGEHVKATLSIAGVSNIWELHVNAVLELQTITALEAVHIHDMTVLTNGGREFSETGHAGS